MEMVEETNRRIVEAALGRYEAQQEPFGGVCVLSPGHVLIECGCKECSIFTNLVTICSRCGTDHSATVLKALGVEGLGAKDAQPERCVGVSKLLTYLTERTLQFFILKHLDNSATRYTGIGYRM